MDNASYITLTRQSGLLKEIQIVANNIANTATTGYRAEGVVFAEMIEAQPTQGGSIAMTDARVRFTDRIQGGITSTGGTFDFAIQGDGFFQIETPDGPRLTRNGGFSRDATNELVTYDGYRVLDASGAPIFIPPDAANISVARDGTVSADNNPVAQIGVVDVTDAKKLVREDGIFFRTDEATTPLENPTILQGYLEASNVNPVAEIARMIEVQRSYELGQKFLEKEDERIRGVVRTLGTSR